MDEILIGEKKYVSSKQAAKITGYAKDYIGQLCREGRVPARLVGRSWYVLESAIHDHRFSDPKSDSNKAPKSVPSTSPVPTRQLTWESPHYEVANEEILPSVNRLHHGDTSGSEEPQNEDLSSIQHLQDTWQAWFDRFDHTATANTKEKAFAGQKEVLGQEESAQSEEIKVPIHHAVRQHYQRPPDEFLPNNVIVGEEWPLGKEFDNQHMVIGAKKTVARAIYVSGAFFAIIATTMAVLGTGYLDSYIISNNQVRALAGVSVYNK